MQLRILQMVKVMLIVNMIMLRRMTKATAKMKRKGSMLATWSPPCVRGNYLV